MDSILITKTLSALIYPLGLVFVLIMMRWAAKGLGAKKFVRLLSFTAATILLLASNPKFARWLAFQLERQYPQQLISDVAQHDAIIVLGGGIRIPTPPAKHTQLGQGSDRYWYAARLYRAGKSDKIVLAGGNVFEQPGFEGEAYYASRLLQEWGVPESAILVDSNSRNTVENKIYTARFLREHKIRSALLVTSALHMPRAHRLFSQMSIPITPASADVLIREQNVPEVLNWIPSAAALSLTTVAMHEYYGTIFNELKALNDKL